MNSKKYIPPSAKEAASADGSTQPAGPRRYVPPSKKPVASTQLSGISSADLMWSRKVAGAVPKDVACGFTSLEEKEVVHWPP